MQNDLPSFVIHLLNTRLSPVFCYHNIEHTLFVQQQVIEIGGQEGCSAKGIDLLTVAALWHDTGYINTVAGHEEESCRLAREHLPLFGYDTGDIDAVCEIIMATKIPQSPKNKLGEIIADADLAYLAAPDVAEKAGELFQELRKLDPGLTPAAWNDAQISFLVKHHYFTSYARTHLEPAKGRYLETLLNGIE